MTATGLNAGRTLVRCLQHWARLMMLRRLPPQKIQMTTIGTVIL